MVALPAPEPHILLFRREKDFQEKVSRHVIFDIDGEGTDIDFDHTVHEQDGKEVEDVEGQLVVASLMGVGISHGDPGYSTTCIELPSIHQQTMAEYKKTIKSLYMKGSIEFFWVGVSQPSLALSDFSSDLD